MKNSSKKNFSGKNKESKKNIDNSYHARDKDRSEKNERYLNNYSKNKNFENLI